MPHFEGAVERHPSQVQQLDKNLIPELFRKFLAAQRALIVFDGNNLPFPGILNRERLLPGLRVTTQGNGVLDPALGKTMAVPLEDGDGAGLRF